MNRVEKLKKSEFKYITDLAEYAPLRDKLIISWWSLINDKKIHKLHQKLKDGMNFQSAYLNIKD